ncbi:hypothetical protein AK812_SmicGene30818 [Symbiodinium microadriaticum]|uniref:Uncharacterized protein n=1 Tax=Symbiodinium microadriaticum TaxID=2951 RepID=A0A1Q9CYB9_SYMMI|nr:hypothetical protein AK812_SmicGene30818 [Symbiodinium microadriaticum]
MPLAASIGEADHASNCMGMWARRLLGQESPRPPAKGAPPKATSGAAPSPPTPAPTAPTAEPAPEEVDDDEDSDVELTAEERAEVARIEEECFALERRMRDLSVTQQRSLLENLANASSALIGGLLADTVRRTAQMRSKGAKGEGRTAWVSSIGSIGWNNKESPGPRKMLTGVGRTALRNPPRDTVLYWAELYFAFDYDRCRAASRAC